MAKAKQKKTKPPIKHKAKTRGKKILKRSFFEVSVPMTATKVHLYGAGPEELDGKIVKLDLTKALRGKNFELRLRVKNDSGKLIGVPVSLRLVSSYVRRVMRRGTDYVEDSFEVNCKDFRVRIKPFLITRNKVSRAVRRALRENAHKILTGYVKSRASEELFSEITSNKIQKQLSTKLRKIYPLALCEIRVFEVVGDKGEGEEVEVKEQAGDEGGKGEEEEVGEEEK